MRRGIGRPPRVMRATGSKVLIACEGKACEPGYFGGIRQDRRFSTARITILPHEGTDPLTVVDTALKAREHAEAQRAWDPALDQAWAVFDVDDNRHQPHRWNTAIQRAGSRVRLAISNPAFELWYLLHFMEQRGALDREQALRKLKGYQPDYEKSAALYLLLKSKTPAAVSRAEELLAMHSRDRPEESWVNPSTGVHVLVQYLRTMP